MSIVRIYQGLRNFILTSRRKKEHRDRIRGYDTKYSLTKEQEGQIQAFYAPYSKVDTYFHNYYTKIYGQFYPEYIPDDLHYCVIDPYFNNWMEARYLDNKCYYRRMFYGIAQAKELASRVGGIWFTGDYQPASKEQIAALLQYEPEIVVKKAQSSEGGKGISFIKGSDFMTFEMPNTDIVIQRPLVQHPDLAAVNPTSINTLRLISMLTDGKVKYYSGILRIGINGARLDNACSGGIFCGITEDGKLKKYAYNREGKCWQSHPNTGLVFEGHQLPSFQKCLDAIQMLHVQVPHFRLVSWDFSINEAGEPILVEPNLCYGGIDVHQMCNGPVFGEDTKKILDEVFQNRKN